ncbi:hypothetical protein A9C11_18170 [Pseudomonas citronellolis]|uniref:Uncharacterized protein n=1 Tax=Pseudomonas citronellolis TaxID=53408 RepID=A0A1A9KE54_9PSED|nr:hypothetical protein A9C11_18170 [Pseudomonas citronellolis]
MVAGAIVLNAGVVIRGEEGGTQIQAVANPYRTGRVVGGDEGIHQTLAVQHAELLREVRLLDAQEFLQLSNRTLAQSDIRRSGWFRERKVLAASSATWRICWISMGASVDGRGGQYRESVGLLKTGAHYAGRDGPAHSTV